MTSCVSCQRCAKFLKHNKPTTCENVNCTCHSHTRVCAQAHSVTFNWIRAAVYNEVFCTFLILLVTSAVQLKGSNTPFLPQPINTACHDLSIAIASADHQSSKIIMSAVFDTHFHPSTAFLHTTTFTLCYSWLWFSLLLYCAIQFMNSNNVRLTFVVHSKISKKVMDCTVTSHS